MPRYGTSVDAVFEPTTRADIRCGTWCGGIHPTWLEDDELNAGTPPFGIWRQGVADQMNSVGAQSMGGPSDYRGSGWLDR